MMLNTHKTHVGAQWIIMILNPVCCNQRQHHCQSDVDASEVLNKAVGSFQAPSILFALSSNYELRLNNPSSGIFTALPKFIRLTWQPVAPPLISNNKSARQ
jgi:hypothetical protein